MSLRGTLAVIEAGRDAGLHLGAQVVVWSEDRCFIDEAIGEAAPGRAMTRDTILSWMSCTKALTAVAVAQQVEAGTLELDAPVADVLLDFGNGGKHAVTLRHVLTHTGGFRVAPYRFPRDDWSTILQRITDVDLERGWTPGERAGYHLSTGWFVLGELVRVVTGLPFREYVRDRVLEPLGMAGCYLGMSEDEFDAEAGRVSPMWDTRRQPPEPLDWSSKERLTAVSPGSTGCGPMGGLARLYRMLLRGGELDGARVLAPETVELFTAPHRVGMHDETFQATIDFGLGFILDSKRHGKERPPYGYGAHASPHAFGHSGSRSSVAFADPAHDAAVAVAFNGAPGEPRHNERMHDTLTALYGDLGWV